MEESVKLQERANEAAAILSEVSGLKVRVFAPTKGRGHFSVIVGRSVATFHKGGVALDLRHDIRYRKFKPADMKRWMEFAGGPTPSSGAGEVGA